MNQLDIHQASTLFELLLNRHLSQDEYELHFSGLEENVLVRLIIDSDEFFELNINSYLESGDVLFIDQSMLPRLQSSNNSSGDCQTAIIAISFEYEEKAVEDGIILLEAKNISINPDPSKARTPFNIGPTLITRAKSILDEKLSSICNGKQGTKQGFSGASVRLIPLALPSCLRRFSLYNSIFACLLDRELTHEEYAVHFITMRPADFASCILASSECIAKRIFEVLPLNGLYEIFSLSQLSVQFPASSEESVYIELTISSKQMITILVKVKVKPSLVKNQLDNEKSAASADHALPMTIQESIFAGLTMSNSFIEEDFQDFARVFCGSTFIEVSILQHLQHDYCIPGFIGLFEDCKECSVRLLHQSSLVQITADILNKNSSRLYVSI